tara:strand:+ start:62 stop:1060 length:999 start_codon:yes stop_codon:yes gene_type:complete
MIKVGINGFGRIGKIFFRLSLLEKDIRVVAINDLISAESIYHSMKYDSVHGLLNADIKLESNNIKVNGNVVEIFSKKDPKTIDWDSLNVDLVLESTGVFLTEEGAKNHLVAGAKKVLLSAPPKDNIPMFVYGVNHEDYKDSMKIISNASCTTNCLAPLAKLLNDCYGIESGVMTTVHSATATQNVVDSTSSKNKRLARSVFNNIIPSTTGAANAVGKIIPDLNGLLTGMAFRVPTSNVSVVDFSVNLKKQTSLDEISDLVLSSSFGDMKNVIGLSEDELVSSDYNGDTRTCIFDKNASIKINNSFFKLVCWYDNEIGYSHKLILMSKLMFNK